MNITLVGFMGTGKTVAGKAIAQELGMSYVDIDEVIEKKEGKGINEIFAINGEQHFRKVEKKIAKEISKTDNYVISAGGGIVLDDENIKNLEENGPLICLSASPEKIYERTKNQTHRPLLNAKDPVKAIEMLLEKRRPYYDRIKFQIDTTELGINEVVKKVIDIVKLAE